MRLCLLIVGLMLTFSLSGQLTGPGADAVRHSSYPSGSGERDPIFIYCNATGSRKGELRAVSPGGSGPYEFDWYKWNKSSKLFSTHIKTESGVMLSSVTNLDEGGYRVNISDGGGYAASLTAWIFVDLPKAEASLANRTCDYVALTGVAAIDTFYYNDPVNGLAVKLPNGVRFMWSSSPASSIPYPDFDLEPQTFRPPLTDVTYKIQVTDSFGCVNQASFFYESIHVNADFTVEPVKGDAPLEVSFVDKSIRGFIYDWDFGDSSFSEGSNPEPHIYYIPGEYTVKLTIESDKGCIDSMRSEKIVVEPSDLIIPNVFTPDGDGYNDFFMVDYKSLRFVSMEIFSQSGLKVYGFSGDGERLKAWTGWDGYVNDSSIKASPGIYFYIIRGYGWDDIIYDSKKYRGFLYLYR